MNKRFVGTAGAVAVAVAAGMIVWWPGSAETVTDRPGGGPIVVGELPDLPPQLDLSVANRRAPVPGLPDWSHAGYREGAGLPGEDEVTGNADCVVTPAELAEYGVHPDDGKDDSDGLQDAIDHVKSDCSPNAGYDTLSLIELPRGELAVSRQIALDADYLILRGAGDDPSTGTRVVFRPDENTRYDTVFDGDWDEDAMTSGDGKGGWLWPGRGLFRVQSREVDEDYRKDYDNAPANRKDLFEGTVNVHWKAGIPLADKGARAGDTTIELAKKPKNITTGGYVNVRAANTMNFYEEQQALPTDHDLRNLHMRQQIFRVEAVNGKTITLDEPLEFDVPVDSTSDGSEEIEGKTYESTVSPLVDPVLGVGIENLFMTQVVDGHDTSEATHEYGNIAPDQAMNGIVFKWAVNGWVRGVTTYFTGSHPVVTEEAKNLEIVGNRFVGAWNKGKGGNGYLRGSRVWDSVYAGNVLRGLRHFTFQWSAADNVFMGNNADSDVNFHGGWERNNLVEHNTITVPFEHKPSNCTQHCGEEAATGDTDTSTWYPIWWAAGKKAVKWSGATGPQNVLYANTMSKQITANGPYTAYYDHQSTVYQLGWNGHEYHHLSINGKPITDWAGNELTNFTNGNGIDTSVTAPGQSLVLVRFP